MKLYDGSAKMHGHYPYRYNPKDYEHMAALSAEMEDFYQLLEKYRGEKTERNKFFLDKQRMDLFFSIKHRVVEGNFTESRAQEMRDYFGELFDGLESEQMRDD